MNAMITHDEARMLIYGALFTVLCMNLCLAHISYRRTNDLVARLAHTRRVGDMLIDGMQILAFALDAAIAEEKQRLVGFIVSGEESCQAAEQSHQRIEAMLRAIRQAREAITTKETP